MTPHNADISSFSEKNSPYMSCAVAYLGCIRAMMFYVIYVEAHPPYRRAVLTLSDLWLCCIYFARYSIYLISPEWGRVAISTLRKGLIKVDLSSFVKLAPCVLRAGSKLDITLITRLTQYSKIRIHTNMRGIKNACSLSHVHIFVLI